MASSDTTQEKTILGHPSGLYVLFFTELWERFNYYGMRALLVLYMTKSLVLGYGDAQAYAVYGSFGTLVYAFPIAGGFLADRYLGYRRAVYVGGILMAIGVFLMAISEQWAFYLGLGFLCVGNGFFKPNISSMVGKLYGQNDPRRDRGFTIFYMGINAGALLAPLVCGTIGELYGWNIGFMVAGIGMLTGVATLFFFGGSLGPVGQPPSADSLSKPMVAGIRSDVAIFGLIAIAVPTTMWLLSHPEVTNWILYGLMGGILLVILKIAFDNDKIARARIFLYLLLWGFHMTFWALFEQAGSSLTLFADRNTDRAISWVSTDTGAAWELPTTWFQSINPIFIVALGPIAAGIWLFLQRKRLEPNIPAKFGIGLILLAAGFIALVWGGRNFGENGLTPLSFLIIMYALHTIGELAISPVGLSAVTKLVPEKNVGFFMGFWFLSISAGLNVASRIASETNVPEGATAVQSLPIYLDVFWQGGLVLLATGIVLVLISSTINKLAHGVR